MRFLFTLVFSIIIALTSTGQVHSGKTMVIQKKGTVDLSTADDKASPSAGVKEMPKQGPEKTAGTHKKSFVFQKKATVDLPAITRDFAPTMLIREMPKQGSKKMEVYNYPETSAGGASHRSASSATVPTPIKRQSFFGNSFGGSTPTDNDLAISDTGFVLSVINTNLYVKNITTNVYHGTKSLHAFTSPINNNNEEFDPKVIYDPTADRFVLVCLVGFVDTTSQIIVGFSQTGNPWGAWNLYSLPGNPLNNNLWSDYPMLSMTDKELFLSVNLLYNDSTWQAGFVETLVWQIKKDAGYTGAPLVSDLHSNIKFNNKAIRNLCPVKGGSGFYSPNMYFISNRNLASQNDTVFLVNITDTIGAPGGTVTVKVMKSNQPYYFPPDGRQTVASHSLATNDSRNLGAFYENNMIQYVHNSKNLANNHSTIYYGTITNIQSPTPTVTGYLMDNDTMDFAYPNISYAGKSGTDNSSFITFDHASDQVYPGVSAIRADGQGNFSSILRIQNGTSNVNLIGSLLERWGDYSGSQRRYNKPGEVWMSGYYGYSSSHGAWITQLVTDTASAPPVDNTGIGYTAQSADAAMVYPNPAKDIFSVDITLSRPEYMTFELYDPQGKLVEVLLRDWIKINHSVFNFNTRDLEKGVYLLKITGNNNTRIMKKIVKH